MKKNILTLGLGALLLSSYPSLQAALIAYDGFNGTTVFNGGTGWTGPWTPGMVLGENLTYGSLTTAGVGASIGFYGNGEPFRSLSTPVTSGIVWFSWIQNIPDPIAVDAPHQIRVRDGLSDVIVVGHHFDQARFKFYDGNDIFDVRANSSVTIAGNNFVVLSVDLSDSTFRLYVNPTGLGSGTAPTSAPTLTYTRGGIIPKIDTLEVIGSGLPFTWDEVRVGSTWLAVAPGSIVALPVAPSALQTTVNSFSEITLSWTDNSSNELSFSVERSLDGLTGWTVIATTGTDITTFADTGLNGATLYYYRVRASNSSGSSAYSPIVSAVSGPLPPVPAAPSTLQATVNSFSEITLNWTDNSSNELSFTVERSLDGLTGWAAAGTAGTNILTLQDTGLINTTPYYYRVFATGFGGNSVVSAVVNPTTFALPPLVDLGTLYLPFADEDGSNASLIEPVPGFLSFTEPGFVESASALSYPGVPSSGNGFTATSGGGRFQMTLDTTLPGLARYMSGGRIGGSGFGTLYVSWMARGFLAQAFHTVEFSVGAANEKTVAVGTTANNDFLRLITTNGFITSSVTPPPTTAFYIAKFIFRPDNTSTVEVYINQLVQGAPDITNTGYAQFNTISVAKFGGATPPSVDEFRIGTSWASVGGSAQTPLQTWFGGFGLPTNGTGNGAYTADVDNDGVNNLLEYAFNGNPNVADSIAILPRNSTINVSGSDYLAITFVRRTTPASGIIYSPQASADLADWSGVPVQAGASVNNNDGTETVVFRDSLPLNNNPKRFLRVRVTAP